MALKASVAVLLGCQFSSANKLLNAAERGDYAAVQQVMLQKPGLAAFTGFHGTTSALHRAAAKGHLGVVRAIIEPLKARIREAEAGDGKRGSFAGSGGGGTTPAASVKWRRLLSTVLNQRSHKSLTPLMLACEHGHAGVAAYLLREGADPLATDFAHSRTCLHYAAVGGHADCLRLLCSDSALVAGTDGTSRPLRDLVVNDLQVQACRFIDQRAFGGLTALHFAVVTGSLEAVQALLRAGASIMVKSDGEAFIGDDHLVPGSTPLHVAAIVNSLSIVHAILQTHMEMMNILGTRLDERGRRPWEGSSRTDIRSVRNQFRKLPFHLARERQQPQLMSLVDPRIPIDVALDAARDTEHGIGPKRLGTICSLVLQRSLLHWLDTTQTQMAAERGAKGGSQEPALIRHSSAVQQALAAVRGQRRSKTTTLPAAGAASQSATEQTSGSADEPVPAQTVPDAGGPAAFSTACDAVGTGVSPFAAAADLPPMPSPRPDPQQLASASAPATPATARAVLDQQRVSGSLTVGSVPMLAAAAMQQQQQQQQQQQEGDSPSGSGMQRMASLHGYMGMLSMKRPQCSHSLETMSRMQAAGVLGRTASGAGRQMSAGLLAQQLAQNSGSSAGTAGMQAAARVRFLSEPGVAAADVVAMDAATDPYALDSPRELGSPRGLGSLESPRGEGMATSASMQAITIRPAGRRSSSQSNARLSTMFNRLRSADATPTAPDLLSSAAAADAADAAASAAVLMDGKHSDCGLDSDAEPGSPIAPSEDGEDVECGVCLDALVDVAFAGCNHKLCLECARNLTRQDKKPPHCPFCRRLVVGFHRVSATGMVRRQGGSGSTDGKRSRIAAHA